MVKKKKAEKPGEGGADDSPAGAPELGIHDYVEIFGLQGAKELNGRRGTIVAFVEETGRFGVRLEGDDENKAVKPANLRLAEPPAPAAQDIKALTRAAMERQLNEVVRKLKTVEDADERSALQRELAELVAQLKNIEAMPDLPMPPAPAPAPAPKPQPKPKVQGPAKPPGAGTPVGLQPPPLPREQHNPLPPREPEQKPQPQPRQPAATAPQAQQQPPRQEGAQTRGPQFTLAAAQQLFREHRPQAQHKLPTPPPLLPEKPSAAALAAAAAKPALFLDECENPDPARAHRSYSAVAGAFVCGIIVSQAELFPATWFVWSFLAMHLFGVIFLTDYAKEGGLLAICAVFGLHMGVAASEMLMWALQRDGEDSVGPWSILVLFACTLYLHSFWSECLTLPPDYITSISMFFPMFPAFNAAIGVSCLELFLEWRYFPEYKLNRYAIVAGIALMGVGQALITQAVRTADRNFWASCRNMPEDEEHPEDFVGLEIPNRRIVQESVYRWERHPAYLGAMLWGVGAEVALCNPVMLLIVGFVLWASLLYVALEEEQELHDEFKGSYANYSALTNCWIPLFNTFLENAAFQREMTDNLEEGDGVDEDLDDEEDEDPEEEEVDDAKSEDDMLPTWEGVPKGGALWNRQFREPWMLG